MTPLLVGSGPELLVRGDPGRPAVIYFEKDPQTHY